MKAKVNKVERKAIKAATLSKPAKISKAIMEKEMISIVCKCNELKRKPYTGELHRINDNDNDNDKKAMKKLPKRTMRAAFKAAEKKVKAAEQRNNEYENKSVMMWYELVDNISDKGLDLFVSLCKRIGSQEVVKLLRSTHYYAHR